MTRVNHMKLRHWVLPKIPSTPGVYLVKTPMGSWKSTAIQKMLASSKVKTALVFNPTVSLCNDGHEKFGGKLYSDINGKIVVDDVIVVCGPSIHRISIKDSSGNYVEPDVVVIEEIEQFMGVLHSPMIMRRKGRDIRGLTFYRLAALCQFCLQGGGRVVALDANASQRSLRDLARLTCRASTEIYLIKAPEGCDTLWTGMTELRCADGADLSGAVLKAADDPDHKGMIYCTSQATLLGMAAVLRGRNRSVLTIHGNSTPNEKATLADVNTSWSIKDFDWVLYNDAAGSGIS